MKPPVIITGIPRSGTSMIGNIFHRHGFFYGTDRGANYYNQKGMFENVHISRFFKNYLEACGCDVLGQHPLPMWPLNRHNFVFKETIEGIMHHEGYQGGFWFFKECKAALLAPLLQEAFPDAIWVIVNRNTDGLVQSLLRTSFMKGYKDSNGWRHYISVYESYLCKIHGYVVYSDAVWNGNYFSLETVFDAVGVEFCPHLVDKVVDRKLFHGNA